jgi:hypothetical protein
MRMQKRGNASSGTFKRISVMPGRQSRLRLAAILFALWFSHGANAQSGVSSPIAVSSDGRFIVQADGSPFFWLADTAWDMPARLTREEADHYFRDRAEKGFTVILMVAGGGLRGPETPNPYGALPFIGMNPARPNPTYFEHLDWLIARAAHYGLRIALLPVWGARMVGGFADDGRSRLLTRANARIYGRWLGQRYRDRGIIWVLGGDANPVGPSEPLTGENRLLDRSRLTLQDFRPIWDAMAEGIGEGEARTPFITYHPSCCSWPGTAEPRTSLYLGNRQWLTMNMLQSSHFRDPAPQVRRRGMAFAWDSRRNYEAIRAEYDALPVRPVVDGEPHYEDLNIDGEPARDGAEPEVWNGDDARNAAYQAVFAGAAGHTYGNFPVVLFYDAGVEDQGLSPRIGWREALSRPASAQMGYLKRLMLSRPYFARIPDQSVVIGDAGEGPAHIAATRDRAGSYMMIYLPQGQSVTIDLRKLSGPTANAWWFDPRIGEATRLGGSLRNDSPLTFMPPTSGPTNDWVLVIDDASRDFGPPG